MQCQGIKTARTFLILITLFSSQAIWAADWVLEKQKGNVSIHSQETDSGYKDILVKTTIDVKSSALIALLEDVAFYSQWMHNCLEVKIIENISPNERIINSFFNAPWPVKNRDMVVLSEIKTENDRVSITLSDQGNSIPHHSKFVRMQNMHGVWQARKLENGQTEITYEGGGNPGGNLPIFLANNELIDSMFKTFQNLNKVILLDKYQSLEITD